MSISQKTVTIINEECKKIAPHYDGYQDDLFELISEITNLEMAHAVQAGSIVNKIEKAIDDRGETLLENANEYGAKEQ